MIFLVGFVVVKFDLEDEALTFGRSLKVHMLLTVLKDRAKHRNKYCLFIANFHLMCR
jgi:hypothetical protein